MARFSNTNQPAIRNNGPAVAKSNKTRQMLSDAYRLALHREVKDADGKPIKVYQQIANKLVEKAIQGDMRAIKEIFDRTEGRPAQAIDLGVSGKVVVNIGTDDADTL